mmetsp:Transcript_30424/g.42109  ORF Transcript_30424/g.42109 Transcript_30424/m.42109 type:complete len:271 (+) Transcript_30424:373-1185(+)
MEGGAVTGTPTVEMTVDHTTTPMLTLRRVLRLRQSTRTKGPSTFTKVTATQALHLLNSLKLLATTATVRVEFKAARTITDTVTETLIVVKKPMNTVTETPTSVTKLMIRTQGGSSMLGRAATMVRNQLSTTTATGNLISSQTLHATAVLGAVCMGTITGEFSQSHKGTLTARLKGPCCETPQASPITQKRVAPSTDRAPSTRSHCPDAAEPRPLVVVPLRTSMCAPPRCMCWETCCRALESSSHPRLSGGSPSGLLRIPSVPSSSPCSSC